MSIKLTVIGVFLLCINTQLFANEITYRQDNKDSLVLKKIGSKKEVIIYSGRKIKIWQKDNLPIKGLFKEINQGFLTMIVKKREVTIPINQIQKLKMIRSTGQQIISYTLITIGIVSAFTGTFFLIAAIAEETAIGSTIAGALGGISIGGASILLTVGELLNGRKFNLENKWSIQTSL